MVFSTPIPMLRAAALSTLALTFSAALLFPLTGSATDTEFLRANTLLHVADLKVTELGKVEANGSKWKFVLDTDKTELYTRKSGDETKLAAMRSDAGSLELVTWFTIKNKAETAQSVAFKDSKLVAFTDCDTSADKDAIGRICVTATARLCQNLRKGEGIEPETLKEIDLHEMKALASILTLRGADHQLDNVVKSGNRLGLRTSLQTTKGQIYTLAKQIAKETANNDVKEVGSKKDLTVTPSEAAENKLAKTVLEKSLPRLRDACVNGKFSP